MNYFEKQAKKEQDLSNAVEAFLLPGEWQNVAEEAIIKQKERLKSEGEDLELKAFIRLGFLEIYRRSRKYAASKPQSESGRWTICAEYHGILPDSFSVADYGNGNVWINIASSGDVIDALVKNGFRAEKMRYHTHYGHPILDKTAENIYYKHGKKIDPANLKKEIDFLLGLGLKN